MGAAAAAAAGAAPRRAGAEALRPHGKATLPGAPERAERLPGAGRALRPARPGGSSAAARPGAAAPPGRARPAAAKRRSAAGPRSADVRGNASICPERNNAAVRSAFGPTRADRLHFNYKAT